ncbi:MAG: OadG family transporter subunit [Anaerolineales bacterium]
MDLLLQGLTLSITGILVTFSSLGLLILIIIGLQRLFPAEEDLMAGAESTTSVSLPDTMSPTDLDPEVAAAIAIAVEHFRAMEYEVSGIGSSLEQGPGAWWHARQFPAVPSRPRNVDRSK